MNEEYDAHFWDALQRRFDPKSKIPNSRFYTMAFVAETLGETEQGDKCATTLGKLVIKYLREGSMEQAEELFADLVKFKRNFEELPRREAYAWTALRDYWKQVGRSPSKRELRKFMEARRETYREQPSPDRPWADLWKESGLNAFWEARQNPTENVE